MISLDFRKKMSQIAFSETAYYDAVISNYFNTISKTYFPQKIISFGNLIEKLRNIQVIGWTTLIFGILLYISDRYKLKKIISIDLTYRSAIFIGCFQILSLIHGVSRSGISITAARFLNYKRFDAAKISFLLSIPTLGAVSLFGLKHLFTSHDENISLLSLISIFFSYIISLITINYFLKYIKNFSLNIFVSYRILLGLVLLSLAYLK